MSDDDWWLNSYVMFSIVTCMEVMLLLRPPSRAALECGPPARVKEALVMKTYKLDLRMLVGTAGCRVEAASLLNALEKGCYL